MISEAIFSWAMVKWRIELQSRLSKDWRRRGIRGEPAINPGTANVFGVWIKMSDPRNVAHDKKVKQEKSHQDNAPGAGIGAKKKRAPKDKAGTTGDGNKEAGSSEKAPVEQAPGDYEKSQTVLSKLKELDFHSRANIETLAQLTLIIDDELKQKEFSDPVGKLYSAQNEFQTQVAALVESYGAKCESLKPSA
ncbi:MAG: hypothetical protein QOH01_669 [Verrucomicrobiota bacterium]|jgi:hypothetical protein